MQFSMKQFLTGILNSDSYRLSAYSKGHRSLEAIGGVRPRYVGVTWARAATRIRAGLAAGVLCIFSPVNPRRDGIR